MLKKCSLKIREIELKSGAVVCEHKNSWHTLCYQPFSLKDLCVNHYTKRYMTENKTELTNIPNWQRYTSGKFQNELNLVMLLCKNERC